MVGLLEVSLLAWGLTIAFIAGLFLIDLGAALFKPREVGFKEAVSVSVIYIAIAIAFGVLIGHFAGWQWGGEFFAGYILEKSLSVDNLFVFVVIMSIFAVPKELQQRALIIGIFLALVFRVIFIIAGAALLNAFSVMFLVFGVLLLYTGIQLFRHRNEDPDVNDNIIVKTLRKKLPYTESYSSGKFITKENGRRAVTPLFLVLIALGTTDLLFALDSIPAIFGVTQEVYLVFVANAFALLGLRALYFLVTGLLDRLVYLSTGLSAILVFIGIKLSLHWGHLNWKIVPEITTGQSLIFIGVILLTTTIASIIKAKRDPSARAHAGAIKDRKDQKD